MSTEVVLGAGIVMDVNINSSEITAWDSLGVNSEQCGEWRWKGWGEVERPMGTGAGGRNRTLAKREVSFIHLSVIHCMGSMKRLLH